MTNQITYLATAILVLHGVVHLLGTAVYLELAELAEFSYKTMLLGGTVDVGDTGMRVFGALWAVAAVGLGISFSHSGHPISSQDSVHGALPMSTT